MKLPREHPYSLAIFRTVVCSVTLLSGEVHGAWRAGAIVFPIPPRGWPPLPTSIVLSKIAYAAVLLGCIFGLVGLRTRLSLITAAIGAYYLLGVAQLSGNVVHDHHLLWFLAILAASPAGDALSIDARDRGGPVPEPSPAYGVPIFFARALIAIIFFFPGLWKLRESGLAWIFSDNLRNQMWAKWAQYHWVPSFRIDLYPRLLRVFALLSVAFELTFPLLIISRHTRKYAAIGALFFHAAIEATMRIPFSSLWLCYVVFVDWKGHFERVTAKLRPEWLVGAALLAGNLWFGTMGWMNGWPFACYPTFQWRAGVTLPGLVVEDEHGATIVSRPITQAEWGVQWSLLGLRDRPLDRARLLAAVPRGQRFYRVWWSVVPEDRDRPPLRRELVLERPLRSDSLER